MGTATTITLIMTLPAWALAGSEMDLPELGSKRRVVMAEMRIAGANLLDSSGDRLEFIGGPAGLPEASTSSFSFDTDLTLTGGNILFPRVNGREETSRRFRQLSGRITHSCGKPESSKGLVATWVCKDTQIELRADAHGDTELTISPPRHQREQAMPQAKPATDVTDEVAVWSPRFFHERTTATKRAVENLLHDLGHQKFLQWGYRMKGSPLGLRLDNVEVPHGIDGIDGDLLKVRFLYFVRGNWNVDVAKTPQQTDIDLDMRIVETDGNNPRYAVQLTARAAHGKARGRVLYSRSQHLTL